MHFHLFNMTIRLLVEILFDNSRLLDSRMQCRHLFVYD